MGSIRTLGLAVAAAMALMSFMAGSASATALYNGETKLGVGSTFKLSLETGVKVKLTETGGGSTLAECSGSTIQGVITNAGGASSTVSTSIEELTWSGCSVPVTTDKNGGFEFHQVGTGTNGTVTTNAETKVTFNTIFFGICAYGASAGRDLGIITTGIPATYDEHFSMEKLSGSEAACPTSMTIEASFISTVPSSPGPLRFEMS